MRDGAQRNAGQLGAISFIFAIRLPHFRASCVRWPAGSVSCLGMNGFENHTRNLSFAPAPTPFWFLNILLGFNPAVRHLRCITRVACRSEFVTKDAASGI